MISDNLHEFRLKMVVFLVGATSLRDELARNLFEAMYKASLG